MKSLLPGNCRSCLCGTAMSNYTAVTALFTEILKPERDLLSLSRWSDQLFEECPWLSLALGSRDAWTKVNGCSHRLSSAFFGEVFTGKLYRFGSLFPRRMGRYLQENNLFWGLSVPALPAEPGAVAEYAVMDDLKWDPRRTWLVQIVPVAGELMIYLSTSLFFFVCFLL